VNGLELFLLGRRLMKLGQSAVSSGRFQGLPTSVQSVLIDVFEHPDTAIGGIVARTGLPQSHVSTSVARLIRAGVLEKRVDPNDGRRTLVRPTGGIRERVRQRGAVGIEAVLREALGTSDARTVRDVERELEGLARRFRKKVSP
jgi:DNA-binding MarR family transcriptional regulator